MVRYIHDMNNGCPSHIGDKSGLQWLFPTPVAQKAAVHPAGSKSIRRNSDVSPIAVLVDHEISIHTRLLCWGIMSSAHLAVTEITFLSRDPKFALKKLLIRVAYAQSS